MSLRDLRPGDPIGIGPGSIVLEKYRVESIVGRGGMGLVATARHLELGHRVALKALLVEAGDDRHAAHHRLMHEALAAACLRSPHTAKVLDVGTLDSGEPVMVVEYLEGRDAAETLAAVGPFSVADAVLVITQTCEALAEAHALGIVHRDIKLANLFLLDQIDGSRHVKVLDFGIAMMTAATNGSTPANLGFGSPAYVAPERIDTPDTTDPHVDIWSLGVCLYELLTGRTPFEGDSVQALFVAILIATPEPVSNLRPDVPLGLSAVIQWCLDKDPERRPANVAELAKLLESFGPIASEGTGLRTERVLSTRARRQSKRPALNAPLLPSIGVSVHGAQVPRAPSSLSALTQNDDRWKTLDAPTKPSSRTVIVRTLLAAAVGLVCGAVLQRANHTEEPRASAAPVAETKVLPVANAPASSALDASTDAAKAAQ